MRTSIKSFMDRVMHPLGLNVERFFGKDLPLKSLVNLAQEYKIDLLLDVGANTGQFAKKMIEAGFKEKIVSFEPLSSAYPSLKKNAESYAKWEVFEKTAIGDFDGDIIINVSENSHSSSILQITKQHTDAAPSAKFIDKETVPINRLDSISRTFASYSNLLLKIDTQGFEKNVLDGAESLLKEKVKLIQLEMSLLPLYDGVIPFEDLITYLQKQNFKPLFYSPGYIDRNTDQIQQLEGYFIKT